MKMFKQVSIVIACTLLSACSSTSVSSYLDGTNVQTTSKTQLPPTKPESIVFLSKPPKTYIKLAEVSVSSVNVFDIKRQRATINWIMDEKAAET